MIHCIGNSHVNNFSNNEIITMSTGHRTNEFILYHLGPVIAYNFLESHMSKVREIIKNIPTSDYISLIVGEVDCRLHLPQQADNQNKTDKEIVDNCIDRLFRCYDEIIDRGYKVIVFSTHPTTTEEHDMSKMDRPIYGNVQRRNNICVLWNKRIKEICKIKKIPFISFYDYLVDDNNITKMEYFQDYCHLNSKKVYNFILKELQNNHIL